MPCPSSHNKADTGVIGGVHLLPIYPSSGDGGFAPLCYNDVDPHFGTWEDVEAIAKQYDLMLELMVNHISPKSAQFQDFLEKGDASEHASMFIDWQKFWGFPGQSFASHRDCRGLLSHPLRVFSYLLGCR